MDFFICLCDLTVFKKCWLQRHTGNNDYSRISVACNVYYYILYIIISLRVNYFYYTSLEIPYAKALYQSGCYFVRSHCYITRYLRETTNGLFHQLPPLVSAADIFNL